MKEQPTNTRSEGLGGYLGREIKEPQRLLFMDGSINGCSGCRYGFHGLEAGWYIAEGHQQMGVAMSRNKHVNNRRVARGELVYCTLTIMSRLNQSLISNGSFAPSFAQPPWVPICLCSLLVMPCAVCP